MLVMLSLGLPASCAAVATSLTTPTVKAAAAHPAAWESSVTPLHLAVMEGSSADVELLLATGEDFAGADFDGQTPLHVAAAAGERWRGRLVLYVGENPNMQGWITT